MLRLISAVPPPRELLLPSDRGTLRFLHRIHMQHPPRSGRRSSIAGRSAANAIRNSGMLVEGSGTKHSPYRITEEADRGTGCGGDQVTWLARDAPINRHALSFAHGPHERIVPKPSICRRTAHEGPERQYTKNGHASVGEDPSHCMSDVVLDPAQRPCSAADSRRSCRIRTAPCSIARSDVTVSGRRVAESSSRS
jgi:hypothetical protein